MHFSSSCERCASMARCVNYVRTTEQKQRIKECVYYVVRDVVTHGITMTTNIMLKTMKCTVGTAVKYNGRILSDTQHNETGFPHKNPNEFCLHAASGPDDKLNALQLLCHFGSIVCALNATFRQAIKMHFFNKSHFRPKGECIDIASATQLSYLPC